jgi:hypothetical protein
MAALAAALAFVAVDSAGRLRAIMEISETAGGGPRSIAVDSASPSGLEGNQHVKVVPLLGTDGYHWVMQTQQMLAEGRLRVRHVSYDGPPDGRAVHWSASLYWIAALAARIESAFTGRSVELAVGDVFTWANTAVFALLLIGLVVLVARRFGPASAALVAIGTVATYPTYELFVIGNFDHHGLAAFAALGTVLFLVAGGSGWVGSTPAKRTPASSRPLGEWLGDSRQTRKWFIASGISGGVGLWISAATEVPTLIGIGIAACVCVFLASAEHNASWRPDPAVWRAWGIAGAITSVTLYAVEYFPSEMALHLEVNHPLYALAWLGAGDLLCRMYRVRATGGQWNNDSAGLALDVLMIATVPATALLIPESCIQRPDTFNVSLHQNNITEFSTLADQVAEWTVMQAMAGLGLLLPVVLIPAALVALNKRLPAPIRAMVAIAALPTVLFLALALQQGRWLGIATSLSLCVLVALLVAAELTMKWTPPRRLSAGALLVLAFLPFPALTIQRWTARDGAYPSTAGDFIQVVTRDVAQKLRSRAGNEHVVVASGPTTTTWMSYFGGLKGIGSLYWENREGLMESARLFGAPMTEQTATQNDSAFAHIRRLGVTHVVLYSWNAFATEFARLAIGLGDKSAPQPQLGQRTDQSFGSQLIRGAIPGWLRPLPYRVPAIAGYENPWVLVLEVAPDRPPEEVATHSAQYCLAMDDVATAIQQLGIALDANAAYVPALILLGRVQAGHPEHGDVRSTVSRIRSALGSDGAMPLEDRISLASLYVTLADTAAGRVAMIRAVDDATETEVRRLPWDYTAANFFMLARQFGLAERRPEIMNLVFRTLDPSVQVHIRSPAVR